MIPANVRNFDSLQKIQAKHDELLNLYTNASADRPHDDIADFIRQVRSAGTCFSSDRQRSAIQAILDYWGAALYRLAGARIETQLSTFDLDLAAPLGEELCPYLGLHSFQERDVARFFGREALIDRAVGHLNADPGRSLLLVGTSASGKTSLLCAGILPKMTEHGFKTKLAPNPRDVDPLVGLSQLLGHWPLPSADDLIAGLKKREWPPACRRTARTTSPAATASASWSTPRPAIPHPRPSRLCSTGLRG